MNQPLTKCVEWPFARDNHGYGGIQVGGRFRKAHRVFFEMFRGPIPDGMCVLHKCDNPACVNPDHLWLGTHAENMADRKAKGRYPVGASVTGAKLTDAAVRDIRSSDEPLRVLAARYGCGKSVVHAVKQGRAWRHVPIESEGA